jgi:hypothetical protein
VRHGYVTRASRDGGARPEEFQDAGLTLASLWSRSGDLGVSVTALDPTGVDEAEDEQTAS